MQLIKYDVLGKMCSLHCSCDVSFNMHLSFTFSHLPDHPEHQAGNVSAVWSRSHWSSMELFSSSVYLLVVYNWSQLCMCVFVVRIVCVQRLDRLKHVRVECFGKFYDACRVIGWFLVSLFVSHWFVSFSTKQSLRFHPELQI